MTRTDAALLVIGVLVAWALPKLSGIKNELKEVNRNLRKIRKCTCDGQPAEEEADHIDIVIDEPREVAVENKLKVNQQGAK